MWVFGIFDKTGIRHHLANGNFIKANVSGFFNVNPRENDPLRKFEKVLTIWNLTTLAYKARGYKEESIVNRLSSTGSPSCS